MKLIELTKPSAAPAGWPFALALVPLQRAPARRLAVLRSMPLDGAVDPEPGKLRWRRSRAGRLGWRWHLGGVLQHAAS